MQTKPQSHVTLSFGKVLTLVPWIFMLTIAFIIMANVCFFAIRGIYISLKDIEPRLPQGFAAITSVIFPYKPVDLDFKFSSTLLLAILMALIGLIFVGVMILSNSMHAISAIYANRAPEEVETKSEEVKKTEEQENVVKTEEIPKETVEKKKDKKDRKDKNE